ncbi:hypothetical protein [Clostridium taeniosporum]|uniref:Exosortase n=1 Tax=Clostridium taeniosporum TaxID=394958 RepID=A0A1D7XJE3_9CLOT|nr:hypothetical protein [Clostridium taeniosporum]AOR23452.1 hypothetical protein BGI42_06735 [Clostridium taeniosporum]
MKKIVPNLGGILTIIAIIFTRYIVSKYGENSRIIIVTVALCISIIGLIGIIYSKKYLAILWALAIAIPSIVMAIGIYLDNIYISSVGFLLIFILIPIMIKYKNEEEK